MLNNLGLLMTSENKTHGITTEEGIKEREGEDGDGDVAEARAVADGNGNATVEAVDTIANQSTPDETDRDVAGIMDTKVEARPAVDERIGYHDDDKRTATHEQREEKGDGEGVGGMGGEETVVATTIAVDDVDEHAYLGVVSGSPTRHEGFHDHVVDGACQQHAETCGCHDHQDVAHGVVALQHHVEQGDIEGYPRAGVGEGHHQIVEKERVAAVEQEQQFFIEVYEGIHG